MSTSGYSGTPLWKKLGIKDGQLVLLLNAPDNYEASLKPLPAGARFTDRAGSNGDLAQVFVTERESFVLSHGATWNADLVHCLA
jgi:hypothetical protein